MKLKTYYLEGNKYRIWLVLAAMCMIMFTVACNTTAIMNALINISHSLNLAPTALQWLVNSYLLACAVFIVAAGQLADMYGRRNMLLCGCSLFIISSIIISLADSGAILILGRALQGFSAAIVTPCSLAVIKAGFPERMQARGITTWTAMIGLGFAIGPIVGGFFTSYASWRDIFWTSAALMFIAMILVRLFAKKSRNLGENITLDWIGLILLVFGLSLLTLGIIEGNVWGWHSLMTLILLIIGTFLLIVFWFVEHWIKSPLINFYHFRKQIFIAGNIGMAASIFVLLGILYYFNTLIQNPVLFHYSPILAGIALFPMSVTMFIFSLSSSRINKVFGFRGPMVTALVLIAIGTYLLHDITITATYYDFWFPLSLCGAALGISYASSPTLGLKVVPASKAGEGAGIINTVNYYSGILCVSLGTLFSIHNGRHTLMKILSFAHLSQEKIIDIDKTVLGHQGSLESLLIHARLHNEKIIINAVKKTIVSSFSATMIMCTIVACIAAIAVFFLLTPNRMKKADIDEKINP